MSPQDPSSLESSFVLLPAARSEEFGSRFLKNGDDVFAYNAWDNVELDDESKKYAEERFALQKQSRVSDFDKQRFNDNPSEWWNRFYKKNAASFFRDRKWLWREFASLSELQHKEAGPRVLLEIGAGAGNTAFPILASSENPALKIHACDYSEAAVEVMRNHQSYDPARIRADVWDVTSKENLPPGLDENSVDVALMIFTFSALAPIEWDQAIRNIHRLLKPGGMVCFRDYGRGDLTQVRFRQHRFLDDNFYVRGDGTRVYFCTSEELKSIWTKSGDHITGTPQFGVEQLAVDRRLLVNRARRIKMHRCWIQAIFVKEQAENLGQVIISPQNP